MVVGFTQLPVQSVRKVEFYWWRKLEYSEKTTDLLQVTDTLSHNVVSSTHHHGQDSNSQLYALIAQVVV
jgi:hypothetical protein